MKEYLFFSKKDKKTIIFLSLLIVILLMSNILINRILDINKQSNKNNLNKTNNEFIVSSEFSKIESLEKESSDNKLSKIENLEKESSENEFSKIENLERESSENEFSKIESLERESSENKFSENETIEKHNLQEKNKHKKNNKKLSNSKKNNIDKNIPIIIELNTADSALLTTLNGIGPVFANRIIKYKNLLGGYYSKNQLLEVYGFTNEKLDIIKDFIIIDTSKINKLDVNNMEFKNILRHPYFDYETTKNIVNERDKTPFTSLNDFILRTKIELDSLLNYIEIL